MNTQMNRYEFIEKLRAALTGKTTQSVINENIRYYEEYLDTEIRKGKSEETVITELGDPRLLAKTIIEAGKRAGQSAYSFQTVDDVVDFSQETESNRSIHINGKTYRLPVWAAALILVLIVVVIVTVIGAVLSVVLPIVLPLLLLVMAAQIILLLLKKK